MVSRLCDDGVQGRDGRCVENSSCFQIVLFVPVCILLLGSPAGLILWRVVHFHVCLGQPSFLSPHHIPASELSVAHSRHVSLAIVGLAAVEALSWHLAEAPEHYHA